MADLERELLTWLDSVRGSVKDRKGRFVCALYEDDAEVRIVTKAGTKIEAIQEARAAFERPGERERIAIYFWRRLTTIKGFLAGLDPLAAEKLGDVLAPDLAAKREAASKREAAAQLILEAAQLDAIPLQHDGAETERMEPRGLAETAAEGG